MSNPLLKKLRIYLDIRDMETEELLNAPTEWLKTTIEHNRSATYMGVIRTLTLPLNLVGFGAFLLRREFYTYLLGMLINIRIDQQQQNFNYKNILTGKLDPTTFIDGQSTATATAISSDFTTNVDAYSSVKYALSLNGGIYVQLPPIQLAETATLIPGPPPDGNVHADYFIPLQLINNQQNSIDASSQAVQYNQIRNPDYSNNTSWFFTGRTDDNKVYFTGDIQGNIIATPSTIGRHLKLYIINQSGTILIPIVDVVTSVSGSLPFYFTFNHVLSVDKNERLYLYQQDLDAETSGLGLSVTGGQINLAYRTETPATMCQALTGEQVFAGLLQQMNVNTDSGPLQPVAYQSYLLKNALKPLVFTSSDSIRAAQGSFFKAGNTLGDGVYKVVSTDPVDYNGTTYATNQQFGFDGTLSFSNVGAGIGVIQKIQSIYVGNVYNPGETLQAGGTYLAEGDPGTYIIYNTINYPVGTYFKYVLGQDTFTGSDTVNNTNFVKQVAEDPQLIISFDDFFQDIKGIQGGNAAFGVDSYNYIGTDPVEKRKAMQGIPFIEELSYVFRNTGASVNLGDVSKGWKRETAVDLMYNAIDIGYNDQQYDAINGFQEVNSKQTYTIPILSPNTKLNLVCADRADPIGVETVRITQGNSAASRSDNDTFMIWIDTTPVSASPFEYYQPLPTSVLTNISGVDPSYYNFKLSPKSNLERGWGYLNSIFFGLTGYQLTLSSALKNSGMVYTEADGNRVSEHDPLGIGVTPAPLFIPMYDTVTVGQDITVANIIDTNPYAPVAYSINGITINGFISSFKSDIGSNSAQQLKLLLSPFNSLKKYIR